MAALEWQATPDGWQAAGYRIQRLDGSPPRFRLETTDDAVEHGARRPTVSVHRSLQDAKRRAGRDENDRVRLARVRGHMLAAAAALALFSVLIVSRSGLGTFAAAVVFLYIGLRSFAEGVAIGWGEAWSWTRYDGSEAPPGWLGRRVAAFMERLHRRRLDAARNEGPPAIIMLPPDLEE